MADDNKKEGVSVKEIQDFATKNKFEVFFCILFLLACLFTLVFWGPTLSIFIAGLGGIIGTLIPARIELFSKKMFHFVLKQEKTTQLVLGIVGFILAIFLAPLIFLLLGLHGGKSLSHQAKESVYHD